MNILYITEFKNAIHKIRNILRALCITGMDSMRHICFYTWSRCMTRNLLHHHQHLPPFLAWEEVMEQSHQADPIRCLQDFYSMELRISHYHRLFGKDSYVLEFSDPARHLEILNILDSIPMHSVLHSMDIMGWIYESHLKTGHGKDMGQYFTDRGICELMVSMCNVKVEDSICDPSVGTGGLLLACLKNFSSVSNSVFHLKNVWGCDRDGNADRDADGYCGNENNQVDWEQHRNNTSTLHGYDVDSKIVKLCKINMWIETRNHDSIENIRTCNSLYEDLILPGYDVFLVNMPFGLKGIDYNQCSARIKSLNIPGVFSEPLFLQLIMSSLNPGGRCSVVVPDGVLSNLMSQHVKTRQHLMDHFELHEVIKVRGSFFMHTSIQPSILFFTNTGPTTTVRFSEIHKNKTTGLLEKKVLLESIPISRIAASSYSLIHSRYEQEILPVFSPFPVQSLSEICLSIRRGKRCLTECKDGNGFPYHDIAGIKRYVSTCLIDEKPVLITPAILCLGRFIYSTSKCYPSHNMYILSPDETKILPEYMYYYCMLKTSTEIKTHAIGIKPAISLSVFDKLKIIVPSLSIQKRIVESLQQYHESLLNSRLLDLLLQNHNPDSSFYTVMKIGNIISDIKLLTLQCYQYRKHRKDLFLRSQMDLKDKETYYIRDICSINKNHINFKDVYSTIRYMDLSSVENGKLLNVQEIDFETRPTRAYRKVLRDDILWGTVRPRSRKFLMIDKNMIDSTLPPLIVSSGFVVLHNEQTDMVLSKFIYLLLTADQFVEYLFDHTYGTTFPSFLPQIIMDYKIPKISIEKQQELLTICDDSHPLLKSMEEHISELQSHQESFFL